MKPPDMDACSVPPPLAYIVGELSEATKRACRRHDAAYALGGDEQRRALEDARFHLELLEGGMEHHAAELWWRMVRTYGRRRFGTREPWTWPSYPVPEAP